MTSPNTAPTLTDVIMNIDNQLFGERPESRSVAERMATWLIETGDREATESEIQNVVADIQTIRAGGTI